MTGLRFGCDDICQLAVGDHPSVTKPSYITYADGQHSKAADIEQAIKSGLFVRKQQADPQLIKRIREGALLSDFTPKKVILAIQACTWTPD